MLNRLCIAVVSLLFVAAAGIADTNTPYPAEEHVTVATGTRLVTGKLKESQDKNWIHIVDDKANADVWIPVRAIELITKAGGTIVEARPQAAADTVRLAGTKYVVYVHGICKHEAGYSDDWWRAMKPFVSAIPDANRREVLWSDLVTPGPAAAAAPPDRDLAASLRETLTDRAIRQRMTATGDESLEAAAGAQEAIPFVECVDDFVRYLSNRDIRNKVIGRFTAVVKPLLQVDGAEIEVISHSWGTVVAYEALRLMDSDATARGSVHNLFTVGSALSIWDVKHRLLAEAADGHRPRVVQRWVNLNARFDVVGGAMKARPFAVDQEFLNLKPFGCSSFIPNPVCAHGSYFRDGNSAVNRDIFAAWIAR
jgi:hypothetical protein